jgi:hypothetical protein
MRFNLFLTSFCRIFIIVGVHTWIISPISENFYPHRSEFPRHNQLPQRVHYITFWTCGNIILVKLVNVSLLLEIK